MYFPQMLPLLAIPAWYDWKDRDIPNWCMALSWLIYGVSFAVAPYDLGIMLLMMVIPIFGIGLFWSFHLAIEFIYAKRMLPRKIIRKFRFGEADIFLMPLMLALVIQFGGAMAVLWAVATFAWASLWFNDLKPGSYQKRHGIPLLTFAFISLVFCVLAALLLK
jgi:hypothetical protein